MSEDDSPKVSGLAITAESDEKPSETVEASNVATESSGTNGTKAAEEKEVVTDDAPIDGIIATSLLPPPFVSSTYTNCNCYTSSYCLRLYK